MKIIDDDIYIIGGASMYKKFIKDCNKMYLTEIDKSDSLAKVYLPKFNKDDWNRKVLSKNYYNNIYYKHVYY